MKLKSSIGDVFEASTQKGKRVYLQLVHIDPVQMNSDVVVVWDEEEKELFYTHTSVNQGLDEGLWRKIDSTKVEKELGSLVFKIFIEDYFDEGKHPFWYVWTCIDDEWREIPMDSGKSLKAERGDIFPASDVVYRIENGTSEFRDV